MSDKVAIVTGANTGLGYELACQLLNKDYEVILACRSLERGEDALRRIMSSYPNTGGKPVLMELDLADLNSVREFASKFKAAYSILSVLVNNAGLFSGDERSVTKDGFELTVCTNHLGHFLLTNLLLSVLRSTAASTGEARIVVVTSSVHLYGSSGVCRAMNLVDFDDMMMEKKGAYTAIQAYRNSKAMNVMFTKKLSRMLENANVTVNCICPGYVPATEIGRNGGSCGECLKCFCMPLLSCFGITRSLSRAGGHMCDLCVNPELKGVTGHWYLDGRQKETSAETRVEESQEALWSWSCDKCGIEPKAWEHSN